MLIIATMVGWSEIGIVAYRFIERLRYTVEFSTGNNDRIIAYYFL
jgi:hypothetical protein